MRNQSNPRSAPPEGASPGQPPLGSPLSASQPGEFTRMLESPLARGGHIPQPSMFPPSSPTGGSKEAGEFTRMLESPFAPQGLAGQPLAAPPPRPQTSGDATRAFHLPAGAQPEVPAQQGPSEFTKMFKAPAAAPPEPAPKPAKKPAGRPPLRAKKTNYLLWILIGLAVVLALALLLYFALK
jgi:hypothetical protein